MGDRGAKAAATAINARKRKTFANICGTGDKQ
jgi:hypothetical protein